MSVTISSNGTLSTWYNDKGQLHREDGPAWIQHNHDGYILELWYQNGRPHRVVQRHNDNVMEESWYKNGLNNRVVGAARIERIENGVVVLEQWHEHGNRHRVGGPAVIQRNEDGNVIEEDYYLYGLWIEKADYIRRLNIIKRFANTLKNKYRNSLVSSLKETGICDEMNLYNIIAEYVI